MDAWRGLSARLRQVAARAIFATPLSYNGLFPTLGHETLKKARNINFSGSESDEIDNSPLFSSVFASEPLLGEALATSVSLMRGVRFGLSGRWNCRCQLQCIATHS